MTRFEREKLEKEILKICAKYEEKFSYIISKQEENLEQQLLDLFYELFEKVYTIILKYIKRESIETLSKEEIANLLFKKDGKTLEDRVRTHIFDFTNSLKDLENKIILLNKICKIARTEVVHLTNAAIYYKLKDKATHIVVYGGGSDTCDCEAHHGIFLAEEFDATTMLPPFHSNCGCSAYLIIDGEEIDV